MFARYIYTYIYIYIMKCNIAKYYVYKSCKHNSSIKFLLNENFNYRYADRNITTLLATNLMKEVKTTCRLKRKLLQNLCT